MRNLIVTLFVLASIAIQAQEEAIDSFFSSFEKTGTIDTSLAQAAESAIKNNANLVSPEAKAKFYYAMAKGNMANTSLAVDYFGKLANVEGKPYFVAKNKDTKQNEYYPTQAAADAATATGNYAKAKEKVADNTYSTILKPSFESLPQKALEMANKAYKDQDFSTAAKKFKETYLLSKAMNNENGIFAFFSALAHHQAKEYDQAVAGYKELLASGYTGEKTTYVATLTAAEQEVTFKNAQEYEQAKTNKLYSDFKVLTEESKEGEIYGNLLSLLSFQKKYDEMKPYLETALQKFPDNEGIAKTATNYYFLTGQTDKFKEKLAATIRNNPNDPEAYFNLGALMSEQENLTDEQLEEAKGYYLKAIELDPKMEAAYANLALLILRPEGEYVEKINSNLNRKDPKQKKIYDEYTAKRKALYQEVVTYLEKKYELTPNDYGTVKSLRSAYSVLGMFDKEDELLPIEKKLREELRNN